MNILICNDDGYLADGLSILAEVASKFGQVRVIAPELNRSGVSNSLTLDRSLHLYRATNGFYYVDGTPTDCIHLAMHAFSDFQPDLFLSGINHGPNMGDDTLYSGTVAAATEAYLFGIPALALSLTQFKPESQHWQTARHITTQLLSYITSRLPEKPILWNINIPAVPVETIQGWQVTRLGRRQHTPSIIPITEMNNTAAYRIGPPGQAMHCGTDTDFACIQNHGISITPLSIDQTDFHDIQSVTQFWQGITI